MWLVGYDDVQYAGALASTLPLVIWRIRCPSNTSRDIPRLRGFDPTKPFLEILPSRSTLVKLRAPNFI
jgi:hypothetical protein